MPIKPLKPCLAHNCPEIVVSGYCFRHRHIEKAIARDRNKRADPFYVSTHWRNLREWHFASNPLCALCGQVGRIVDHIDPIKQAGEPMAADNLQTLCSRCHNRKHRGRPFDRLRARSEDEG